MCYDTLQTRHKYSLRTVWPTERFDVSDKHILTALGLKRTLQTFFKENINKPKNLTTRPTKPRIELILTSKHI